MTETTQTIAQWMLTRIRSHSPELESYQSEDGLGSGHLHYMLAKLAAGEDPKPDTPKAHRWLGYAQALAVSYAYYTLDGLKELNKTLEGERGTGKTDKQLKEVLTRVIDNGEDIIYVCPTVAAAQEAYFRVIEMRENLVINYERLERQLTFKNGASVTFVIPNRNLTKGRPPGSVVFDHAVPLIAKPAGVFRHELGKDRG